MSELYKIIMVGPGSVGKSALTLQFMYSEFVNDYEPTKADSYRKQDYMVNGKKVSVDILDTAGQEDYAGIRDNYYRLGEGFVLVFSLSDEQSFKDMDSFREQILRVHENKSMPFVLIGNKCDLEGERVVDRAVAEKQAHDWNIPYFEASAKTKENVNEAYLKLCCDIEARKAGQKAVKKEKKKKPKCCLLL